MTEKIAENEKSGIQELHTVMFVTRRKDNKVLAINPAWHERRELHVAKLAFDETEPAPFDAFIAEAQMLMHESFKMFANKGADGEVSRMYVSLNAADNAKCQKVLMHKLIDQDVDMMKMNNLIASIVASPEARATRRWLIDCDCSREETEQVLSEIREIAGDENFGEILPTYHNWCIITPRGFDNRTIVKAHPDAAFKRADASIFVSATKPDRD